MTFPSRLSTPDCRTWMAFGSSSSCATSRPAMRIFMISGYYLEDDARILEAMRASAIDGFLAKPFQIDAIVKAVIGPGQGNSLPENG